MDQPHEHPEQDPRWEEKQVELQDVVLSNSWALQAILEYLEEQNPGARQRIFEIYQILQAKADQANNQQESEEDSDNSNSNENS